MLYEVVVDFGDTQLIMDGIGKNTALGMIKDAMKKGYRFDGSPIVGIAIRPTEEKRKG